MVLKLALNGAWLGSRDVHHELGRVANLYDRSVATIKTAVASRNQSHTHSDSTGLNRGDRSWICNAPPNVRFADPFVCQSRVAGVAAFHGRKNQVWFLKFRY